MSKTSVIDIPINDQQFREFYELFKKFRGDVGEMPEEWKKVGESAASSHEALAGAAGAIVESMLQASSHAKDLAGNLKDASLAQKQFRLTTGESETGLKKLKHEAKELSDTIFGIGKFVLKLGTIGLGTSIAGLFGFDKLAQSAIRNQREARSLGLSTGEYRAFQTDLGRYVDPSALENVANAKNDLMQQVWLQRASGLSLDQIGRTNTGDLAAQLAIKAHDWWASAPDSQKNSQFLQSTGFTQLGFTLDDMRRLGATDRASLVSAQAQYGKDSRDLNISNRDTDAFYSFTRQLTLAGQKLESAFTNRLAQLGPTLGSLMTTLERDAEILINEVFSPENVRALESGIDTLVHFLGSQEFRNDVKILVDGIGQIGKAILGALKLLAPDTSDGANTDKDGNPLLESPASHQANGVGDKQANGGDTWVNRYFLDRNDYYGGTGQANATWGGPYYGEINPKTDKGKSNLALLGGLEKIRNLPDGLLAATVAAESSGIANAKSNKGAMGAAQLMPDTAKWLGVTDPNDFGQSVRGEAKLYAYLQDHYKGDLRKEIGAYNWGPGNLDKAVAKYGDDWEAHAPAETQNHIKRVLDLMAKIQNKPVNVNVVVTNKAGANIAVSANAASGS
ncbi:lytic transglycosylase domain-containing protein [Dyella sp.]|uniref:lytic transglycosylase domain-containing protein n=1 Tax=Dyella sp. TaxID=1869338 RepID=UPI002847E74D|nr:lytic transglycosylase domain-containing protein [Dyella sp.]MDR3445982.1 lytic transglycosylase domain-containing protein [Dyella sp.]